MATNWFRLSLEHGGLEPVSAPAPDAAPTRWTERDLEHLLALNPSFLGVVDQCPLRLDGGSTSTLPDQAYADCLGRLTVVELKSAVAGLNAVAQALAYADHWRMLPFGEVNRDGGFASAASGRSARRGRSLDLLRQWAGREPAADDAEVIALGAIVSRRIGATNEELAYSDLAGYAFRQWGQESLPLIGSPARIVIAAADFHDECVEFAQMLSKRMVAIELIQIDVVKARGEVYVGRRHVHREEQSEPTWQMLRRLWQNREIRDEFRLNGWADALNREAFSLSLADVPSARLWFEAYDDEGLVYTTVPDRWFASDGRRNALRVAFLKALPPTIKPPGRWPEWSFRLPVEAGEMATCILAVARAVRDVLGPAAADARAAQG